MNKMKDFIDRLKSPVIWAQVVSIIGSTIVTLRPEISVEVKTVIYCITTIINLFAGLNNPTDRENF